MIIAKGEELASLYKAERDGLECQISRRVGCRSTAGDLVQEICLRLWERATDWTGDSAAYLNRCGRNAAIDHLRAEKTRAAFLADMPPEPHAPATEDIVAARQTIHSIDQALATLPQRTRHIFLLNRVHGRSFSEIAAAMGISKRAVEKQVARAVAVCVAVGK